MKKHLKLIGTMMTLAGLIAFSACSKDDDKDKDKGGNGNGNGNEVKVASVTLDKKTASVKVGATTTLTATVNPSDATNKTVTWASNANSIATVNNGTVTGVAAGSTYIVVTTADGSFKDSCAITVTTDGGTPTEQKNILKVKFGDAAEWTAETVAGTQVSANGETVFIIAARKSATKNYPSIMFGGFAKAGSYVINDQKGFEYIDSSKVTDGTNSYSDWQVATRIDDGSYALAVVVSSVNTVNMTISGTVTASLFNTIDASREISTFKNLSATYTNVELKSGTTTKGISTEAIVRSTTPLKTSGQLMIKK